MRKYIFFCFSFVYPFASHYFMAWYMLSKKLFVDPGALYMMNLIPYPGSMVFVAGGKNSQYDEMFSSLSLFVNVIIYSIFYFAFKESCIFKSHKNSSQH